MKKRVLIIGVALTGVSIFASDNGNFPGHKLAENIKFEERFSAAAEEPVGNEDGCRMRYTTDFTGLKSLSEASDDNLEIIYDRPEGEVKYYSRSGYATTVFMGNLYFTNQSGNALEMVVAPDGKTIYIKDLISSATAGTWIKGTREGNSIHIPMGQPILYNKSFDDYLVLGIGEKGEETIGGQTYTSYLRTEDTEVVFNEAEDGTLTIQSDIMQDNEDPTKLLGLFSYVSGSWQGYSNWNTTFTPVDTNTLQFPEGASVEDWHMKYQELEYEPIDGDRIVHCAVVGDKFYLQGLSEGNPKSCIVGTIEGDKVIFPSGQFLGIYSGYVTYFCGAAFEKKVVYDEYFEMDMEKTFYTVYDDYVVGYDAQTKTLTGESDEAILVTEGYPESGEMIHLDYFCNYTISLYNDISVMPVAPNVTNFYDYMDEYGYNGINLAVSTFDADNNFLNPEKLFYILWIKRDGVAEKYTFGADKYVGFADAGITSMTEVPYLFECLDAEGYIEISKGGRAVVLHENVPDEVGVQSVYYGGGQRLETPVSWLKVKSGINDLEVSDAMPAEIYSINGMQLNDFTQGVNIVKMTDGTVRKVIKR